MFEIYHYARQGLRQQELFFFGKTWLNSDKSNKKENQSKRLHSDMMMLVSNFPKDIHKECNREESYKKEKYTIRHVEQICY